MIKNFSSRSFTYMTKSRLYDADIRGTSSHPASYMSIRANLDHSIIISGVYAITRLNRYGGLIGRKHTKIGTVQNE